MAPITDAVYFPPLEPCLHGDRLLLGWEDAYAALCDVHHANFPGLNAFLADASTQALLQRPLDPFQTPSAATKSQFETLTAAIHVTPAEDAPYNITQIKEDALWLAQQAKFDEVAALRIVVLEWQKRPVVQLVSNSYEDAPKEQEESNGKGFNFIFDRKPAPAEDAKTTEQVSSVFDSTEQRRGRLLGLYLSERLHILKSSEFLFRSHTIPEPQLDGTGSARQRKELCQKLFDSLCPRNDSSAFILQCSQALNDRVDRLNKPAPWSAVEDGQTDDSWIKAQILEMGAILQYVLGVSVAGTELPSAEAVSSFFNFMDRVTFFAPFANSAPELTVVADTLRLVTQLACLAILNIGRVLEFLAQFVGGGQDLSSTQSNVGYLSSPSTINDVNNIFVNAAEKGYDPAASAMLAWSSVIAAIRDSLGLARRGSDDSIGRIDYPNLPQKAGNKTLRECFVEVYELIEQSSSDGLDSVLYQASRAVDQLRLFDQIADMNTKLEASFGEVSGWTYRLEARRLLLSLIEVTMPLVRYSPETLGALLAVLAVDSPYWDFVDRRPELVDHFLEECVTDESEPIRSFLSDAQVRYPAEPAPFYQLMRTMISNGALNEDTIAQWLAKLHTANCFTLRVPEGFRGFEEQIASEMGDDLEDEFSVPQQLLTDLPYFVSQRHGQLLLTSSSTNGRSLANADDAEAVQPGCIPEGTIGVVAADDIRGRPIISWTHEFSPLRYMVGCLYTILSGNDMVVTSTGLEAPIDEVCDIISLLTTLVIAIQKSQAETTDDDTETSIRSIVEGFFIDFDPKKDLLNIVSEIFETQLQLLQQEQPGSETSLDLLVSCLKFFHAVGSCLPKRIWPLLARSRLLDLDGNGGGLVAIVTSIEMITGNYEFLLGCIRLFEVLVEASLKPGSALPTKPSKALTRFNSQARNQPGAEILPQRVAGVVMTTFSRTLVSVFGSFRTWRFSSSSDQAHINTRLATVFDKILHYTFGFDDEVDLQKKAVTSILADAATHLADALLSDSNQQLSDTLLYMLNTGLEAVVASESTDITKWQATHITSALALSETTIRIGARTGRPTSSLERQLLKGALTLARLYSAYQPFKAPVSSVLEALVTSAARIEGEPPSLLGHMGPGPARDFLSVLGHLSRPLDDLDTELSVWKMLSAVVCSRQQWFTISLLTGSAPKDRQKNGKDVQIKARGKPMLTHALDQLTNINAIQPKHELAIAEFITSSQNHWSWAVDGLQKHPTFISALTGYVRSLKREKTDNPLTVCTEAAVAASIAEILAMYLHSAFQVGDNNAAKAILPHLQYFRKYGVAAPKYNSSLHMNLKANMEKDHGGLQPTNFKHTLVFPTEFGVNYFYDVAFASKVLNLRRSRKGKALQGMESNLELANSDLSQVEAQIDLLEKWKLLVLELSKNIRNDDSIPGLLIEVVNKCLSENAVSTVPQPIFDRLRYKRLDLALVLLQKLVAVDVKDGKQNEELRNVFANAWETVLKSDQDFDMVFAGDDVQYYRTLLQILFLSLKPLTRAAPPPSASKSTQRPNTHAQPPKDGRQILEVLLHVVAKGFRSLASTLHENPKGCEPNDFVLLTAILQTVLRIPGVEFLHSQIALQFANDNLSGYATSLFSWADQLLLNGDPVYGELTVLFLLEMSTVPLVAESMAVDGVLSQLTSANIMQLYSRPKGMGPFDAPTRLHSIWTKGLLPLCLNLLDAVGAPIAAEIVSFLNQFPNQLARLGTELANRNSQIGTRPNEAHITLGMASEVHSLSLIWLVLERFRNAGAGTGTLMQDIPSLAWEKAGIKEDVDDWVQERRSLGNMVLPANEREAELARAKASGAGGTFGSRLEERVFAELGAAAECLRAEEF